jgi:hypothetical protein
MNYCDRSFTNVTAFILDGTRAIWRLGAKSQLLQQGHPLRGRLLRGTRALLVLLHLNLSTHDTLKSPAQSIWCICDFCRGFAVLLKEQVTGVCTSAEMHDACHRQSAMKHRRVPMAL